MAGSMTKIKYFALVDDKNPSIENPSGIFREVNDADAKTYKLARLDPSGKWILDNDLIRYRWKGEIGAEPIPHGDVQEIIDTFLEQFAKPDAN